jgi:hypothetical protein
MKGIEGHRGAEGMNHSMQELLSKIGTVCGRGRVKEGD